MVGAVPAIERRSAMRRAASEDSRREQQRRIDATLDRARVRHMSNAKWRKVFAVCCAHDIAPLRFKFVRDERVFPGGPQPRAGNVQLGDESPAPYAPYREIDWVELPLCYADDAEQAFGAVGRFPLVRTKTGLRIVGYEW